MSKIGTDILTVQPPKISEEMLSGYGKGYTSREKVYKILKETSVALSTTQIAKRVDLSWYVVTNVLKDLLILGIVEGKRDKRAIKYWLKTPIQPTEEVR